MTWTDLSSIVADAKGCGVNVVDDGKSPNGEANDLEWPVKLFKPCSDVNVAAPGSDGPAVASGEARGKDSGFEREAKGDVVDVFVKPLS